MRQEGVVGAGGIGAHETLGGVGRGARGVLGFDFGETRPDEARLLVPLRGVVMESRVHTRSTDTVIADADLPPFPVDHTILPG